jgi:hypothetical protein
MLHSAPNEAWGHPAERCRDGPGVGVGARVGGSFVREREGGERRVTEEKETGKRERERERGGEGASREGARGTGAYCRGPLNV